MQQIDQSSDLLEKKSMRRLIVFFAVSILIAALHFSSVNNEINGLGGDNARYILVAKSIASLEGYRDFTPGKPPHVHYPPVFPLLLAPVIWLLGVNFAACHAVVVFTDLMALLFLYLLFKHQEGQPLAILVILICALNPFINLSLVRILSEFPYLMVTSAALLLAEKSEREHSWYIQYLWLPIIVSIAYFTRWAGLSFIVAFIFYRIYRGEFKPLLWNAPILILPRLLWMIRTHLSGFGEGYFSLIWLKDRLDPAEGVISVPDAIDRALSNILYISQNICDFIIPFPQHDSIIILILICGLVVLGFIISLIRKKGIFMELYVLIYLMMLVNWPIFETRKLIPIMPFIYLYLFVGINFIVNLLLRRFGNVMLDKEGISIKLNTIKVSQIVRLIGILLIASQLSPTIELLIIRSSSLSFPSSSIQGYKDFKIDWSHFYEAYYWVKSGRFIDNARVWADYLYISHLAGQLSPPDSSIISRKPTLTALYSGRQTIDYPFYRDFNIQREHIIKKSIDYIILDGISYNTYRFLVPYINANPKAFQIVTRKGNAFILSVNKDRLEIDKTGESQ